MTVAADTSCRLIAFSPSSGIGVYVQQDDVREFDLVAEEDAALATTRGSVVRSAGVTQFATLEALLAFATTAYLRDKKQSYYSTLLIEELDDDLRDEILDFLDASELVGVGIAVDVARLLCDIGRPNLAAIAFRHAVRRDLTNVQVCLLSEFGRLLVPPWGPEDYGVWSHDPAVPLRVPAGILHTARPHREATRWVGLTTRVPKWVPDSFEYVSALGEGDREVREHFVAQLLLVLQKRVIPGVRFMAEDVVHTAVVRILNALERGVLGPPWHLMGFAHAVLRNVAIDAWRKERRYVPLGDRLLAPVDESIDQLIWDAASSKREPPWRPELSARLHHLLKDFAKYYPRAARVVLLQLEDWSARQIAEMLQMDVRKVHADAAFARKWLRKHLVGDPEDKPQ